MSIPLSEPDYHPQTAYCSRRKVSLIWSAASAVASLVARRAMTRDEVSRRPLAFSRSAGVLHAKFRA